MSWSATPKCFLNTSRDGDSTTSLGSLFQCQTTLSVKKFFITASLNLSWRNLRPLLQIQVSSAQSLCLQDASKINVSVHMYICMCVYVPIYNFKIFKADFKFYLWKHAIQEKLHPCPFVWDFVLWNKLNTSVTEQKKQTQHISIKSVCH